MNGIDNNGREKGSTVSLKAQIKRKEKAVLFIFGRSIASDALSERKPNHPFLVLIGE